MTGRDAHAQRVQPPTMLAAMLIERPEHREVEEERQHRLRERGAARGCRCERDVGGLRGDRDREGEVEEVPVIRLQMTVGKLERGIVVRRLIVMPRVVQREHRRDQEPGAEHRRAGQHIDEHRSGAHVLRRRQLDDDRHDARDRRDAHDHQHGRGVLVLAFGERLHVALARGRHLQPDQHEIEPHGRVPADQRARGRPHVRRNQSGDDATNQQGRSGRAAGCAERAGESASFRFYPHESQASLDACDYCPARLSSEPEESA